MASSSAVGQGEAAEEPRFAGIGEQYFPFGGETLTDPYALYQRARSDEPVFHSPLFDMWFVTRHADVLRVLRDPTTFSSRNVIRVDRPDRPPEVSEVLARLPDQKHLINSDPPEHTRLRTLMNQAFTPSAVERLEPEILAVADGLIDGFAPRGRADLLAELAYPFPLTVIMAMLGVPAEDRERCRRWSESISVVAWGAGDAPIDEQVARAEDIIAFQAYAAELVHARAGAPQDDLVSAFLQAGVRDEAPLTPDELVSLLPGFVLAGHETTANLIANALALVLERPALMERLGSGEDSLAAAVVEEVLRFDTSVLGMPRVTTRAVELGGVELPAGAELFVLFGSANRDEAACPHADVFDPGRTRQHHLGFGRGIHACIGAPLARAEARVALQRVLTRLPDLRIEEGAELERSPSFLFRAYAALPVTWGPVTSPS